MVRKLISITLCAVMLLSISAPAFAATNDSLPTTTQTPTASIIEQGTPDVSTNAAFTPIFKEDDVFGFTGWPSLSDAMNKYGTDFTYHSCTPFTYNAKTYNYYYKFSDGSRMFFGVVAK